MKTHIYEIGKNGIIDSWGSTDVDFKYANPTTTPLNRARNALAKTPDAISVTTDNGFIVSKRPLSVEELFEIVSESEVA